MSDTRKIMPAPESLVQGGRIQHGVFDAPPKNGNLVEASIGGPALTRSLRFKKWQFFLLAHPECAVGFVIIDIGYSASSFLYVFDRKTRKMHDHKRIKLSRDLSVADNLWDGRCYFREKNYSIEIRNNLDQGFHDVVIEIAPGGKAPGISGKVRLMQSPGGTKPLVVSLPVGDKHSMYSHKVVCAASGNLTIGGNEITYDPTRDVGIQDEHKAYYPRHTYWKWATCGFIGPDGRTFGFNMTDNMIKDQKRWNENAVMTSEGINLLGPAHFTYDQSDLMKPWTIRDGEGKVDLTFTPHGIKLDNTNLVVMRVDYRQPFGVYNGKLIDAKGEIIEVRDAFGVTEYFNAHY